MAELHSGNESPESGAMEDESLDDEFDDEYEPDPPFYPDAKGSKCPQCGSTDTTKIMYGYMSITDELREKIDKGKVRLGGCTLYGNDPARECNACNVQFGLLDENE